MPLVNGTVPSFFSHNNERVFCPGGITALRLTSLPDAAKIPPNEASSNSNKYLFWCGDRILERRHDS